MQEVVREATQDVVRGESMRPTGSAVGSSWSPPIASWGSVVAGTVALLAVSLLLSGLALAVVAVLVHPTLPSLKGGAVAIWLSAVVATLIGAAVGGTLAGRGAGRARSGSGAMHGFLAWCLALVVTFGFQAVAFHGMLGAAVNTAVESAAVAFERSTVLTGDPAMPGGAPGAERPGGATGDAADPTGRSEAAAVGRSALHYVAGFGWSWFGTWFLAGIVATASAAAAARRRPRVAGRLPEEERSERLSDRPTTGPFTTAPSA